MRIRARWIYRLVCLSLVGLAVLLPLLNRWLYVETAFDTVRWKQGNPYHRGRIVKDLRDRRLLEGLSREQVLTLLGEPDCRLAEDEIWEYSYAIGGVLEDWFDLQLGQVPQVLILRFDSITGLVKLVQRRW